MSFKDAIKTCFSKYFTFSGRAARPEYWYFFLFIFVGTFVTTALDNAVFGVENVRTTSNSLHVSSGNGPFSAIFLLASIVPILSAGWRRMHDTGRSGLYLLYPIIAMIGLLTFMSLFGVSGKVEGLLAIVFVPAAIIVILSPLIVIWWLSRPTQLALNTYGPNPYEVSP